MDLTKDYKKKLQLKTLEMVKEIDKICRENKIEYYLFYGSCLGAVRHKGFIPWDDDFDIAMTDENYFKFLQICEEKLDRNKYYVQTYEKEENYYLSFAKIRDITTTLIEEGNSNIDITYGIYIDIFPLVGVPNNKIKRILLKINRAFMLSANMNIINNKFLNKIFNIIKKIFGRKRILKYCTKACFKYKSNDCEKVVSIADGDGFEINEFEKRLLGKPKYVDFEDTKLPIPQNYHSYLKQIYNDYKKIPTEEEIKKKEHTPYFLDFNLPYAEYKKNKKKKILFIIWSFTYGGGAEKILANIVNNLDTSKYEIDIIEYWNVDVNKERVSDNINVLNPIIKVNKDSKIKKLYYHILLEICPNHLRRKYIKKEYDLEIAFNYLIPTFLLSRKCKTISWIHGDIYDLNNNRKNYLLQKKSFKYVDKIVAISDNTFESIKKIYPEYNSKLIVLNNGYDLKKIIDNSGTAADNKNSVKKLLFINRFDENKNPLFALDVAKELVNRNINFKLWYLGKGELEEEIKTKIKELKLDEVVEIFGYQKNPYPYIKDSHIILGCSKSEGFPTIFIEGIALGKPFVTTPVGGVKEISDNQKCGLIAENFNDYVDKVEMLLTDDKKYEEYSKHGVKHVKRYSLEKQIKKIESLIDEI